MRALYRAEVVGDAAEGTLAEILDDGKIDPDVREYANRVFNLVLNKGPEIDERIRKALTRWDLKRLAVIDRCVLRIGVAELLFEPDIPTRVILDEAIEIAKRYGTSESGRFVNGVLDGVARGSRPEEFS